MAKSKPHNWRKFNDWRFNLVEKELKEENESTWTILYKGMIGGFRKAKDKRLEVVAKAVGFFIKTEYGVGAKNDFIKAFKKSL